MAPRCLPCAPRSLLTERPLGARHARHAQAWNARGWASAQAMGSHPKANRLRTSRVDAVSMVHVPRRNTHHTGCFSVYMRCGPCILIYLCMAWHTTQMRVTSWNAPATGLLSATTAAADNGEADYYNTQQRRTRRAQQAARPRATRQQCSTAEHTALSSRAPSSKQQQLPLQQWQQRNSKAA